MRKLFSRFIFDYKKLSYDEIWGVVAVALRKYYPEDNNGWNFRTKRVKLDLVGKMFSQSFGEAHNQNFSISIASDGSRYFSDLMIIMCESNMDFIDHIARSLVQYPEFIFGYVADKEFIDWQNASTPYSYIMAKKPHEHLPRIAGQVLGKDIFNERLDLSGNPGRTVFHMGYVEAICGVLYVTEKLTRLSGGDLHRLHDLPFLRIDDWLQCLRLELDPALLANADQNPEMCSRMDSVRAVLFPPNK